MKINLVMIVRNEQRCIEKSVRAALPFVDDVIVADTGSADRTVLILEKIRDELGKDRTAERRRNLFLYRFQWVDDFSAARNFSLEKSEEHGADWSLVLDADEYLRGMPEYSRTKLETAIRCAEEKMGKNCEWAGEFPRRDLFPGEQKEEPDASYTMVQRLLPRGMRYHGIIHEQVDNKVPCIAIPLMADHDGYLKDGRQKGERNLRYLEKALREEPDEAYLNYQMALTLRNLKRLKESVPYFEAFYRHVCGEQQADDSPYSEYVSDGILRYLYTLSDLGGRNNLEKALHIVSQEEGHFLMNTDYYFYCGILYMKLAAMDTEQYLQYVPRIEACYQRCLAIGERPDIPHVEGTGSFKAEQNLRLWYQMTGEQAGSGAGKKKS